MHGQGHGRRPRPRATPRLREPSLARGVGVVHASTRPHGAGPPSLRPRVPRPPSPHHLAARSRSVVEPAHAGCPSGASPGGGREATASGDAPGRADTPIALPPSVDPESAARFLGEVGAELERQEAEAQAEAQRRGHRFLGAARASEVSPYDRATSFEALRDRNPTFAVGREQGGAWKAAAAAVRAFCASYRAAMARWHAGIRDAVFPAGTWWMRAFHGASVLEGCSQF